MRILTFDIEDWFHILDNTSTKSESEWLKYPTRLLQNVERILDLLKQYNLKATFFCLGWIASKYPDVVSMIAKEGYEIGCHSNKHQLVYEQSRNQFRNDLIDSIDILESVVGAKIRYYRAPGFSIKEGYSWALELLAEKGIEFDSSIFPASRGHGGYKGFKENGPVRIKVNGISIKEFPINTVNLFGKRIVFSGGGYFRFFPASLLNHYFDKEPYIMTYFHPRDFDKDQPLLEDLTMFRKFKSYYGLKNSIKKLDNLLKKFEFMDIKSADAIIDWKNTPEIKL